MRPELAAASGPLSRSTASQTGGAAGQARAVGAHVDEHLRELAHDRRGLGQRLVVAAERVQQQHGRDQAVAGRLAVERDHVPGLLAAQDGRVLEHAREHVAVADIGHDGLDAELAHRAVEAEVRHRRHDDLVARELPGDLQVAREQGDDLVAVDDRPVRVDGEHAVGVAVERDPEVEAAREHALRERRRDASSRSGR